MTAPRLVRHAKRGEVPWHILQHNYLHAQPERHRAYATELGLSSTYGDFPSDLPAWRGDPTTVLERIHAASVEQERSDLYYALRYLGWGDWSLAEMSLFEFVETVRSNASAGGRVRGALRRLTPADVQFFFGHYEPHEQKGHRDLLSLLDGKKQFEPIILVEGDGGRLVHEGNHRTLAACDWLLRNPAEKDRRVLVYYPREQAALLDLPTGD